jgi:hypothetical protein
MDFWWQWSQIRHEHELRPDSYSTKILAARENGTRFPHRSFCVRKTHHNVLHELSLLDLLERLYNSFQINCPIRVVGCLTFHFWTVQCQFVLYTLTPHKILSETTKKLHAQLFVLSWFLYVSLFVDENIGCTFFFSNLISVPCCYQGFHCICVHIFLDNFLLDFRSYLYWMEIHWLLHYTHPALLNFRYLDPLNRLRNTL